MNPEEFFREWSTDNSHLELTARDVASSFPISLQRASQMLQAFVAEGRAVSRCYSASRVTVYRVAR
jgi:hypothetical protein